MRKFFVVLFFICVMFGNSANAITAVEKENLYLSSNWLKREFSQCPKDNIVISPASLYLATAMLAEGATEKTKEELETFLGIKKKNKDSFCSLELGSIVRSTYHNSGIGFFSNDNDGLSRRRAPPQTQRGATGHELIRASPTRRPRQTPSRGLLRSRRRCGRS